MRCEQAAQKAPLTRCPWSAAALICAVVATTPAHAGPASTPGQASAVVVKRLSFIKTADLEFGRIVPGSSAGTVTIKPDGSLSTGGGVRYSGEGAHPAKFSGYGSPNQFVLISVTRAAVQLRRIGGQETMRLETFVVGSTPQAQLTTSPLAFRIASTTGMFSFPLGGTLRVGARQPAGVYSGSFSLTLEYQ